MYSWLSNLDAIAWTIKTYPQYHILTYITSCDKNPLRIKIRDIFDQHQVIMLLYCHPLSFWKNCNVSLFIKAKWSFSVVYVFSCIHFIIIHWIKVYALKFKNIFVQLRGINMTTNIIWININTTAEREIVMGLSFQGFFLSKIIILFNLYTSITGFGSALLWAKDATRKVPRCWWRSLWDIILLKLNVSNRPFLAEQSLF